MVERAPPSHRVLVGTLCAVGLFSGLLYFEEHKSAWATQTWTNPTTGKVAQISTAWEASEEENGSFLYFSSPSLDTNVIFQYFADTGLSLAGLRDEAIDSLASNTVISNWTPTTVNGREALRATGPDRHEAEIDVEFIIIIKLGSQNVFVEARSTRRWPTDDEPDTENLIEAVLSTAL